MQKAVRNDSKVSFNQRSFYRKKIYHFFSWIFIIILGKELLFKNFDFNNRCKNEIKDNSEKYVVALTQQFPKKSI